MSAAEIKEAVDKIAVPDKVTVGSMF